MKKALIVARIAVDPLPPHRVERTGERASERASVLKEDFQDCRASVSMGDGSRTMGSRVSVNRRIDTRNLFYFDRPCSLPRFPLASYSYTRERNRITEFGPREFRSNEGNCDSRGEALRSLYLNKNKRVSRAKEDIRSSLFISSKIMNLALQK